MHRFRFPLAVVLLSLPLASCTSGGSGGSTGSLEWGECSGESEPLDGFECANLEVPLDWSDAGGEKISLALVRLPAGGTSRGTILLNPGGPGASGFDFLVRSGEDLVSQLELGEYDLVGFDPRGVERSAGIDCVDDETIDRYAYVDYTPDDAAEQKLYDESVTYFEDACRAKYGDDLRHFSTANTARDMDAIRAASGLDTLGFIGMSYGTYLGGVYATMFPDRVGAMILDGALDPAGDSPEESQTTQLLGFENAFHDWIDWCESDGGCPFRSRDVGGDWIALRADLDETSLDVDGRAVNATVLDTATASALYSQEMWAMLGSALATARAGDGTGLLSLADAYNERRDDGTYTSSFEAFPVIQCASGFYDSDPADPEALLATLREEAPYMSLDMTVEDLTGTGCEGLTEDADIVELSYEGDAPIVVIGGENDPATPLRWAREMADNLGASARLVTYTGEGHGAVSVSMCVDRIVAKVFADGTLPDDGTTCEPDPVLAEPAWWKNLPSPSAGEKVLEPALLASIFGLPDTRYYVEYRSTSKGVTDAYADLAARLAAAGFVPDDPAATEAIDTPRFFQGEGEAFVGLFTIPHDELASYGLAEPAGPVPAGHTLLAIYWYPPGD